MLSVVHNYYYLLTLLIIHSFRTSICVCKYLYMLSVTFNDQGGAGLMTLTFPLTSAGPGPTSAALKFYIFSTEIAIPLRLMLIPVFHPGQPRDGWLPQQLVITPQYWSMLNTVPTRGTSKSVPGRELPNGLPRCTMHAINWNKSQCI